MNHHATKRSTPSANFSTVPARSSSTQNRFPAAFPSKTKIVSNSLSPRRPPTIGSAAIKFTRSYFPSFKVGDKTRINPRGPASTAGEDRQIAQPATQSPPRLRSIVPAAHPIRRHRPRIATQNHRQNQGNRPSPQAHGKTIPIESPGFEPGLSGPKPDVLPVRRQLIRKIRSTKSEMRNKHEGRNFEFLSFVFVSDSEASNFEFSAVQGDGFEPPSPGSEPDVLPLDDP